MARLALTLPIVFFLPALALADQARPVGPGVPRLTALDQKFLRDNAADALGDLELGRLAQSRAASEEVRVLGRAMVEKADGLRLRLETIARDDGVGLPRTPSRLAEDRLRILSGLDGAAFDQAFVEAAFNDLRDDQVRVLARGNRRGTDPVTLLARDAVAPTRTVLTLARRLHDAAIIAQAREDQQNAYMPQTELTEPR